MAFMDATRRSPLQFGLRFLFLLVAAAAVLSAVLAVAVKEPALLFLLGLAAAVVGLICIGRYILEPLDQAARDRRRPTQFTMVDFLALMFLFQLPMAALHGQFDVRHEPHVWVFDVFAWIACSLMWGFSVATLSRAGIEKTWQRGVFLALVLPAAYFGSIAFTVALFAAGVGLYVERGCSWNAAALIAAILAGLALGFFLSARFVRKVVAESAENRQAVAEACDGAPTDPA